MAKVVVKGTGQGKRQVKAQHKGNIAKNEHDVATKRVHEKYGTMAKKSRYGVKKKDMG
jgi:hypothetical protein